MQVAASVFQAKGISTETGKMKLEFGKSALDKLPDGPIDLGGGLVIPGKLTKEQVTRANIAMRRSEIEK